MTLAHLEQLNETHIDILREIGNIGSGNAATALSSMMQKRIEMDVPSVRILDIPSVSHSLGGPENTMIGILSKLSSEVNGIMMFLIEQTFVRDILRTMLPDTSGAGLLFSELELSAISEVGNILISAYVGSISTLSGVHIKTSVPAVAIDMVGALLCVPAAEMAMPSDKILLIQGDFLNEAEKRTANILLVPDIGSLDKIMTGLGIAI